MTGRKNAQSANHEKHKRFVGSPDDWDKYSNLRFA